MQTNNSTKIFVPWLLITTIVMVFGVFNTFVEAFLGAISGILIGAITGLALVYMLSHPNPNLAA